MSIESSQTGEGWVFSATVTINPGLSGTELEAIVGHEGSHLADGKAFFDSFDSQGRESWDLSKNITIEQSERRAYGITNQILSTANTPMSFPGARGASKLGVNALLPEINKAITNILGGGLYKGVLKERLIKTWDYQPAPLP